MQRNDRENVPCRDFSRSICPYSLYSYTHALARRSTSSFSAKFDAEFVLLNVQKIGQTNVSDFHEGY